MIDYKQDAVFIHSSNPHIHGFSEYPKKIIKLKKITNNDLPQYIKKHVKDTWVCYEHQSTKKYKNEVIGFNSIMIETKQQAESKNSIYN